MRFLLFLTLITLPTTAQEKNKLPIGGIGLGVGFESTDLNGKTASGPVLHGRIVGQTRTYPILFGGIDVRTAFLSYEISGSDPDGQSIQAGPFVGLMIPFDLMMKNSNLPRGVGIPIYVGYNLIDDVDFDGKGNQLDGQSLKFGLQLPLPLKLPGGTFLSLAGEYTTYFFDDDEITPFVNKDPDRSGWNVVLQIGIPLIY